MIKILKPILMTFLTTTTLKRLVVDLLRAICKQTTNTLDDKAVDMLEQQLFPKLN
jgi:hydroxymethylpyrimidine/phosphomethylpyrimidine kinase